VARNLDPIRKLANTVPVLAMDLVSANELRKHAQYVARNFRLLFLLNTDESTVPENVAADRREKGLVNLGVKEQAVNISPAQTVRKAIGESHLISSVSFVIEIATLNIVGNIQRSTLHLL